MTANSILNFNSISNLIDGLGQIDEIILIKSKVSSTIKRKSEITIIFENKSAINNVIKCKSRIPIKSLVIEESNWILANGTWNDNKIWIDAETWRDN